MSQTSSGPCEVVVVVGMFSLGFAPRARSELVPLAAGSRGRAAKALLPLPLCGFISLDVLGIPAGRSSGKSFFLPLNMSLLLHARLICECLTMRGTTRKTAPRNLPAAPVTNSLFVSLP